MTEELTRSENLLRFTAQIVSAQIATAHMPTNDIPVFIRTVFNSLVACGQPEPQSPEPLVPAVPVKKSVFADYIVCLEDGKKLKMLKRHLMSSYNMTPEQYRERWGLPSDYPMVAPRYAERRSELAKKIGLGRKPD